jgi:hypothetical protein
MPKTNLVAVQALFLFGIAKLIIFATKMGYQVTLGRGFVSPEANRAEGGKEHSLHLMKLAQDLCFFKDGVYLRDSADLKIFGDWWKAQGPDHAWGGDFTGLTAGDGNHFSIAYQGMK